MIFGQIHLLQFINHTVIITVCFEPLPQVHFQVSHCITYLSLWSGSFEGQIGPTEPTNIHVFTVLCWEEGQGLNHVSAFIPSNLCRHICKKWITWVFFPSKKTVFNHANNLCCPQRKELLLQIQTLIKTIVLFSSRPVTIHIVNNDEEVFGDISASFMLNHAATNDTRTFEELAVSFAPFHQKWKPFRWGTCLVSS